ncbi:LysR family transcriptional regulator [Nocardiopsis sp. CNT-189]|uniref:LysR family transcriptional regulator n=1 Tax=Nocardiopsis oceanisediminis TaxID=2816862 RepID=UPI003B2F4DAA
MDLQSLRYFRVVARHQHISRAAEELMVAQPSLSRSIARLEADLGVPLFDRRGRQVRLNGSGEAFLRRVDRILGEMDDARRELTDASGKVEGTVALASETMLTLLGALSEFRAAEPGIRVRLYQSRADSMQRLLRVREVDFCVASQPLEGAALELRELVTEEVLLAVPPDHRLAGRDRVSVAELDGEPFIAPRPGYWPRELGDRLFERAGAAPDIVCEGDEPGSIQYLIEAGLGVGLIPAMARDSATRAEVAWVRLDTEEAARTLTLAWHRDAYLSAAARRFRDFVTDWFADRIRP